MNSYLDGMVNTGDVASSEMSLMQGRICIFIAAGLWSLSGFFSKVLTQATPLGLHEPALDAMQIAFFRVFFAALVLVPMLRPSEVKFRPAIWLMGVIFAVMNGLFISSMILGKAANAIFLQYTAPMWLFLASIWLLGEKADRRSLIALVAGMAGIAVIIAGGWGGEQLGVMALGLGSGVTYAAVLLFLRVLRNESSRWLTVWNHLFASVALLPFALRADLPSWPQLGVLFVFGSLQLGIPYLLMARGLRVVSPQEAGTITLIEPILNPIWAFLVSPESESVPWPTMIGGVLIVGGLAWRYWPRKRESSYKCASDEQG